MSAVHVLLIDDQWGANSSYLRVAFANAPGVCTAVDREDRNNFPSDIRLVLHTCRGQTIRGATLINDSQAAVKDLQRLMQRHEISIVLLDMRFDSGLVDSRGRAAGSPGDETFGRVLHDAIRASFPNIPIVYLSTYDQIEIGDESLAYLSKSDLTDHSLAICLLRHGRLSEEQRRSLMRIDTEVVRSERSWRAYEAAFDVARLQLPVMITGETGTGKEVLARYIHRCSRRAEGPFVAVNVNAVPKDLFEAMFFGHMRGAFTGASEDRPGYFEQADGGTLFLDEIGDLPLDLQVKLLRVLETKSVKRLGARQETPVDVRLVSATNRVDAKGSVQGLRDDVKYRLCGLAIHLVPLRDRREDVLPLAERMLGMAMAEHGKSGIRLGASAIEALRVAPLPGNAREVRQAIFSAAARTGNRALMSAAMLDLPHAMPVVEERLPSVNDSVNAQSDNCNQTSGVAVTGAQVTLEEWLQIGRAVSPPSNADALIGSKLRLDELGSSLNRKLAAAALRATRNAVTGEYIVAAAAQLLFANATLRGNVPARKIAAMLGYNQDRKLSNDELGIIVREMLN